MAPILSRYLEPSMDAFFNNLSSADDAVEAGLDNIRSGANTLGDDHPHLIRTEFDRLKAKLDRLS